ncbi:MAG: phosphoribosylformylglycinamidine synthase II, partial [Nitrospirota bacterium]|nr:phosphoribosylformylglycinamidine synthase II [Nitrospirota bacterium]
GESQGRVVLSVKSEFANRVLAEARLQGVPAAEIGTVQGDRLVIDVAADRWGPGCRIDADLETLFDRWGKSLERTLEQE